MTAPSIAILGVPFDNVTTAETVEIVERMVASRRPHYLATANVDFVVQALEDVELRQILFDAHLVLCDGTPLVWASRWLGNPLRERVAGSDLIPLLINVAAEKGYRLFFLGGREDVNQKAVANIRAKHPSVQIVGAYSPPFAPLSEMNHEDIVQRIKEAQPDILLVSFGCPKQEKWIAMHYRHLGVPVCVGVGATVDFLAGAMTRAPRWMHGLGLEWVFRLLQEPRRLFKRYVKDFWVIGRKLAAQWWQLQVRPKARRATGSVPAPRVEHHEVLQFSSRLDAAEVEAHREEWAQAIASPHDVLLDLSRVQFIDSTGVGLLIRFARQARTRGNQLVLIQPTPAVEKALRLMRLTDFLRVASDLDTARALLRQPRREPPTGVQARAGGPSTLAWQGEVTAATADQIWKSTSQFLPGNLHEDARITIDLGDVRLLDSTGLGLMIRAQRLARQHGAKLTFTRPTANVTNVLRIAKLESLLMEVAV